MPTPFGIATTEVIPIREVAGISDKFFLFYYLLLPNVRISLAGKMQGTTGRQRLNKDSLVNLEIPLPPLSEQRTIANILRTIDEKTAALEREVELIDELFHAMLEELMTGKRSAVPLDGCNELNIQNDFHNRGILRLPICYVIKFIQNINLIQGGITWHLLQLKDVSHLRNILL